MLATSRGFVEAFRIADFQPNLVMKVGDIFSLTNLVGTESFVAGLLLYFVGKRAFDRRSALAIAKSLLLCVAVTFLHVALAGLGAWRLLIDIVVYMVGAFATGAVEPSAAREVARMLFQRKAPDSA